MNDTDKIKDILAIEDVVGGYVQLEKAGRNLRACCPFHNERTPSFYVTPDRGIYKCFGCGRGGDIFSFVEEIEGIEFYEALQILAEKAGVKLTSRSHKEIDKNDLDRIRLYQLLDLATKWYEIHLRKTKPVVTYLESRGLLKDTMISFRVGYAPRGGGLLEMARKKGFTDRELLAVGLIAKGERDMFERFRERIMFPLSDTQGRIIGFSGRIFPLPGSRTDTSRVGKYVNSPDGILYDKSKVLYGYDRARQELGKTGMAIIVEGQMDLLMAHQAGTINTIALSGTALTDQQCKIISRLCRRIVLALDGDSAGLDAAGRSVQTAYKHDLDVSVVMLPEGTDPADLIQRDPEAWLRLLENQRDYLDIRLSQLAKEEVDVRIRMDQARAHVYPFIQYIANDIIQDNALTRTADILGVSVDAVRKDYGKWVDNNGSLETNPTRETYEKSPIGEGKWMLTVTQTVVGLYTLLQRDDGVGEHRLSKMEDTFSEASGTTLNEAKEALGAQLEPILLMLENNNAQATLDDMIKDFEWGCDLILMNRLKDLQQDLQKHIKQNPHDLALLQEMGNITTRIDELKTRINK